MEIMQPMNLYTSDLVVDTPCWAGGKNLQMSTRRYSTTRAPSTEGVTILMVHALGFGKHTAASCLQLRADLPQVKELWEPTIQHLFRMQAKALSNNLIREIWTVDLLNHGHSAVLNSEAFDGPHNRMSTPCFMSVVPHPLTCDFM